MNGHQELRIQNNVRVVSSTVGKLKPKKERGNTMPRIRGLDYSEDADRRGIDANEDLEEPDDIEAFKRYRETLKTIEKGEE